ncbi:regulatory protein suaprga1 [Mycena vulgaris]|nr:regulatory protein suaprga1 [Mycena vulgaris]
MSALRTLRPLKLASTRLRLSPARLSRLPQLAAAKPGVARTFSVSAPTLKSTPANAQLGTKLREELDYERKTAAESDTDPVPAMVADFQEAGLWTIEDTPGNDEVFLTRTFGDENIRVMFSISDMHNLDEEELEDDNGEPIEQPPTEFRVSLSITKEGVAGALSADLYCAENALQPANVSFYKSAAIARELTIDADFKRRTLYVGPPFETLDSKLQEAFVEFLTERGIDDNLAAFVPEYAQWKEQREYVEWLESVGKFVGA